MPRCLRRRLRLRRADPPGPRIFAWRQHFSAHVCRAPGYFRAKLAQERLITASEVPYTIVRATQFFEFIEGIAHGATAGREVRLPPALMQPIGADDVAAAPVSVALDTPVNGIVELAGPEAIRQDELVRRVLRATGDKRTVITDPRATYFGTELNDRSLTPGSNPRLGTTRLEDWLRQSSV